jgi:hypothetical protein
MRVARGCADWYAPSGIRTRATTLKGFSDDNGSIPTNAQNPHENTARGLVGLTGAATLHAAVSGVWGMNGARPVGFRAIHGNDWWRLE